MYNFKRTTTSLGLNMEWLTRGDITTQKVATKCHSSGYLALLSMIIISALLLSATLSLSQLSLTQRFLTLDYEYKLQANSLALACVHLGILLTTTKQRPVITTPHFYPVQGESCTILSLTHSGTVATIRTRGVRKNIVTNYYVTADNTTGKVLSAEEVVSH